MQKKFTFLPNTAFAKKQPKKERKNEPDIFNVKNVRCMHSLQDRLECLDYNVSFESTVYDALKEKRKEEAKKRKRRPHKNNSDNSFTDTVLNCVGALIWSVSLIVLVLFCVPFL